MFKFIDLKQQLKQYLFDHQIKEINKAYNLAKKLHHGQTRSTGEPYITHPLAVAKILADMRIDYQSIIAGILHDVLEDTNMSKENLAEIFNPTIAELVDGVSKLDQIKFETKEEAQAENLRKMMLAMAKDIRVILVKLADRLHNMRTLDAKSLPSQKKIALETLEIYAPIANRLGMNNFCMEFEDLGFYYLYPVRYKVLKKAVLKARGNRKEIINNLENSIKNRCQQENIFPKKIYGREKPLYSLYKKMRLKNLSLSEVMDVYAVRIIVENIDDCYRVLGAIHNLYKPIYNRFKDYIAVPKINGYQSLHTTVIGSHGVPVEIQIRTEAMDKMAENGIAAHWLYKSFYNNNNVNTHAKEWLNSILEIQKNSGSSLEFIEHIKIDLYPDEVYVFTPGGDIMSLPYGSTCIDFAYAIHTDIGQSCIAAKIDRRLTPMSTKLSNGQTIEIVTAQGANPNPNWLNFVATGKARSNIRNWLKNKHNTESVSLGKRLLDRAILELTSDKTEDPNTTDSNYDTVVKELNLVDKEELFAQIGLGNQLAPLVARKLLFKSPDDNNKSLPLTIKGTEGMVINYAKCCYPIPGDHIVGIFNSGRGIVIHREHCNNAIEMQRYPEKYIFVAWADNVTGLFSVELKIEANNHKGIIAEIARILSDCDANIENIQINEEVQCAILLFKVQINNINHLNNAIKKLYSIGTITKVTRIFSKGKH
jgi:GTP diphosphokinase / guanosine-3',5'-bis(diphosphate) 3'-diphosphatase